MINKFIAVYSQNQQPGPNSRMPAHYTHSYNPFMPGPGGPGEGPYPTPGPMWSVAKEHGIPHYGGQWSRPKHVAVFHKCQPHSSIRPSTSSPTPI